MKQLASCAALLLTLQSGSASAATTPAAPRPDWSGDIQVLREELAHKHPNLFHSVSKAQFDAAADDLIRSVPRLSDYEVVVGITRLVAMTRDAHSGIDSVPPQWQSSVLPLKFYRYADGVAVQSTAPALARFLGQKLLAIDGMPVDEAVRRVETVTASSNASTLADFAPLRLSRPDLLHALGVTSSADAVRLTLAAGDGKGHDESVHPLPRIPDGSPEMGGFGLTIGAEPGSDWLDAAAKNAPLWLSNRTEPYWMQDLAESDAFYVQCNFVFNAEQGETLADFFDRALTTAEKLQRARFVLDLRLNPGGDNTLLLPVIHRFIRSTRFSEPGRLLVLIGRRTQSAAQNFTNQLDLHTPAVFIGEPTGERPNHYGDATEITLPSSKIVVSVATLYWQDMGPLDQRDASVPDVAVGLTSEDYARGRDPVLEAALHYTPPKN